MEVITKKEAVDRIFALTARTGKTMKLNRATWEKTWLMSEMFVKMRLPVKNVPSPSSDRPHMPHHVIGKIFAHDSAPIFIDKNKIGHRMHNKHVKDQPLIVADGKHRLSAAKITGQEFIDAWVGTEAVPYLIQEK